MGVFGQGYQVGYHHGMEGACSTLLELVLIDLDQFAPLLGHLGAHALHGKQQSEAGLGGFRPVMLSEAGHAFAHVDALYLLEKGLFEIYEHRVVFHIIARVDVGGCT